MSCSEGDDDGDVNTGEKNDDSHGPEIVADNPEKDSPGSDEAESADNQVCFLSQFNSFSIDLSYHYSVDFFLVNRKSGG